MVLNPCFYPFLTKLACLLSVIYDCHAGKYFRGPVNDWDRAPKIFHRSGLFGRFHFSPWLLV